MVDEFTYLEFTISNKMSLDKEIDRLIGRVVYYTIDVIVTVK